MNEEIPPGTGLIDSIRADKAPYHSWAGEAIDNAFDARATLIELSMTKESLDAKDNGIGITRDREQAIVKISQHGEMTGTKLGRYGVGIKYKSIQHGKQFRIQSVSKDGRLRRDVDWEHIRATGRWSYPSAIWSAAPQGMGTGTYVSIRNLITKAPTKPDIDHTRTKIQRIYYPALNAGNRITLNGETIKPITLPKLTDQVSVDLTFPENRASRIWGGVLAEPSLAGLRQVDVCVAYRVIKAESPFGCDGYGGIRSMYAQVVLTGPWKLTKFKDDLAEDPYLDDLEAAVLSALEPVLQKCQSAAEFIKTKGLEQLLNDMLPEDQRMTRPKRKRRLNRKGKKRGCNTMPEVEDSIESQSGPTRAKKPPRGVLIEFADGLHEQYGYGRAQVNKSSTRIQLASDNPAIRLLMQHRDQEIAAVGLFGFAKLLYEGERELDLLTREVPLGLRAWNLGEPARMRAAAA